MNRVEFRLTMPGVGSWNGKWSGEGKNFTIVRNLDDKTCEELCLPSTWTHSWPDGWCALVTARVVPKGERLRKSDGFYGYDWMVYNIINTGKIGRNEK